jgi:hypothetical protein
LFSSSTGGFAAVQPIGEPRHLVCEDRVGLWELGAALLEGALDDAVEIIDRMDLDTGQLGGGRVDIPRNGQIEQEQRDGADLPARECAPQLVTIEDRVPSAGRADHDIRPRQRFLEPFRAHRLTTVGLGEPFGARRTAANDKQLHGSSLGQRFRRELADRACPNH